MKKEIKNKNKIFSNKDLISMSFDTSNYARSYFSSPDTNNPQIDIQNKTVPKFTSAQAPPPSQTNTTLKPPPSLELEKDELPINLNEIESNSS